MADLNILVAKTGHRDAVVAITAKGAHVPEKTVDTDAEAKEVGLAVLREEFRMTLDGELLPQYFDTYEIEDDKCEIIGWEVEGMIYYPTDIED